MGSIDHSLGFEEYQLRQQRAGYAAGSAASYLTDTDEMQEKATSLIHGKYAEHKILLARFTVDLVEVIADNRVNEKVID